MLSLVQWFLAEASGTAAATATEAGAANGGGPSWVNPLVMIGIIFVVMYLFMFAPQRKKEKQRRQMLDAIAKGDDVMTIGGLYGKVWQVKDDEVVLQVSDDVKMTFSRGAIAKVEKKGAEGESK